MQARIQADGARVSHRYALTPEKAPAYLALERELEWLRAAWFRRWNQGS